MKKSHMREKMKRKIWIWPTIIFAMVVLLLSAVYLMFEQRSITEKKARGLAIANSETSMIRDRFDVIFARDYAVSNLIVAEDGDTQAFERVADLIVKEALDSTGISLKNIAVAPDGIVTKVYPLEGNETLIGFDFMDETKAGNTEAIAAYQKGELVVTNPFTLVQGGTGMGGRLPVYLGTGSDRRFWGLVTITIDFDKLKDTLNLDSLEERGYHYCLWYTDADGEKVTLATSKTMPDDTVTQSFAISNLTWNLDLAPVDGWSSTLQRVVVMIAILGFGFMMAAITMDKIRIEHANVKLERLAQTDALTACYTRQYVNTMLVNQRTGRWHNPDVRYSMAMMDIDHFKQINDTYGHENGDRVIVAVSQVLLDNCKDFNGDCVIRYGGDEFIILYNDVTHERFEKKMKKIMADMHAIVFEDLPDIHITVSMGGDFYVNDEQSVYYDQIHRADAKLYLAKKQGRDQYCI